MTYLIELKTFATAWYNLPFTLALLLFAGVSLLQFLGLGQDHEVDIEADLDVEVDIEVDVEADLEPELGDLSGWGELLQMIGVGHIPITLLLVLLSSSFGLSGWLLNSLVLSLRSAYPVWGMIPTLLIASGGSLWFTSRTARLVGRVLPAVATTATSMERLVSRQGIVASPQVDESYGQIKVRDAGGTLITVFAVVDPGQPALIRDCKVFLVEYDPVQKVFVVESAEL